MDRSHQCLNLQPSWWSHLPFQVSGWDVYVFRREQRHYLGLIRAFSCSFWGALCISSFSGADPLTHQWLWTWYWTILLSWEEMDDKWTRNNIWSVGTTEWKGGRPVMVTFLHKHCHPVIGSSLKRLICLFLELLLGLSLFVRCLTQPLLSLQFIAYAYMVMRSMVSYTHTSSIVFAKFSFHL